MDEIWIDLDAEETQVLEELKAFSDICLPAFFAHGGIKPVRDDRRPLGKPDVANRPLHRWRQAVDRLADTLVEPESPMDRGDFEDFLCSPPEPGYTARAGRIFWRVGVGFSCSRESNAYAYLDRMGLGTRWRGTPSSS